MNTSTRNGLIALVLIIVAGVAGGAYLQYRGGEGEVATNTGEVAGETDDSASIPSGTATTDKVKLNETVRIAGAKITPVEVVEDSRCPQDVQCIQAGTVRVRADVVARGDTDSAAQTVMFELGTPMTVGRDQITLVTVEPVKKAAAQIATGDYVFTFTVVKDGGTELFKG